jgi:hypothetical protein
MDHENRNILNDIGTWNTSSYRLRNAFVGCVIDLEKLEDHSFIKISEKEGYTHWEYKWNKNRNKAVLILAPYNTICQIDLFEYKNIQVDDYIGAAYAHDWYFTQDCSKIIEKRVKEIIRTCIIEDIDWDSDQALSKTLDKLGVQRKNSSVETDNAYFLCGYAWEVHKTKPALSRLICCILIRHLDAISNPLPLQDLPYLCGRLGLLPECNLIIQSLLQDEKGIPATCWCNMGAVLSDNLRNQKAALHCFHKSISIDPNLMQPRQGIWIAGQRRIREHLISSEFMNAVNVGNTVTEVGNYDLARHGFFSYFALALEMQNQIEDSKKAYLSGLTIDQECHALNEGFERISNGGDSNKAMIQINRLIESTAFEDLANEDRYP